MPTICKLEGCGNKFEKKKSNHKFCRRKCYRKWYYENKEKPDDDTKPKYICPECGGLQFLEFDPTEDFLAFSNFECPYCGFTPK